MPTPKKKKSGATVTRIGPRKARLYLKEWRRFKDWSQEELAARLGTTKQTISKQENGRRGVTADHLAELAAEFGCRPQDFFSPPERWQAETALDKLDPEQQRRIIAVVESLKGTGTNG
jgi:transcriptional regulator with XRE-family HTH domain